jgi:hypothetical protein
MNALHLRTLSEPGKRIELTFHDRKIMTGTWGYSAGDQEEVILFIDDNGYVHLVNLFYVRSVYVPKEVK